MAKKGTNVAQMILQKIATPRMDATLLLKNAATSSGVMVGDNGGLNPGNMKNAARKNAPAKGVLHNKIA
tara:strand:- start:557 stop:763 length:207 start_codon:yes stop_codon:yes gene_type:complete